MPTPDILDHDPRLDGSLMLSLHSKARTTPAVHAEIARSSICTLGRSVRAKPARHVAELVSGAGR
jgi:hypothetical protein